MNLNRPATSSRHVIKINRGYCMFLVFLFIFCYFLSFIFLLFLPLFVYWNLNFFGISVFCFFFLLFPTQLTAYFRFKLPVRWLDLNWEIFKVVVWIYHRIYSISHTKYLNRPSPDKFKLLFLKFVHYYFFCRILEFIEYWWDLFLDLLWRGGERCKGAMC